jgi:hypothetical protein
MLQADEPNVVTATWKPSLNGRLIAADPTFRQAHPADLLPRPNRYVNLTKFHNYHCGAEPA